MYFCGLKKRTLDMKYLSHTLFIIVSCILLVQTVSAEDWREKTKLLIYSPRYFGPSAFPIPEFRDGVSRRFEVEVRGEYHHYSGDKTKDLFARILIPFVKGRAAVEVSWVIMEKYKLTPATRDERFAAATESPNKYNGDIIFSSFFQVLRNDEWIDATLSANIKTASGGRLCDARFTDAASYWFDLTIGRDMLKSADGIASLRIQALGGFYCWMTNDIVNRQNDAIAFGAALTGKYRYLTLTTDLSGIYGYKNNGDRPLHWRNNFTYEIKKNIISLRYTHGLKDRLYETYSLGYIRCF